MSWVNVQQQQQQQQQAPALLPQPPPQAFAPFAAARQQQQQQQNAGLAAVVFAATQAPVAQQPAPPPPVAHPLHAVAEPGSMLPAGMSVGNAQQVLFAPPGAPLAPSASHLASFEAPLPHPINDLPLHVQQQVANVVRQHQQVMLAQFSSFERAARQQQMAITSLAWQVGSAAAVAAMQNNAPPMPAAERLPREREGDERRYSSDQERR